LQQLLQLFLRTT